MPDSMQICFKTILGRPEYLKCQGRGTLLQGALPCRSVPRPCQVRSPKVVAAWLAEMLQWHRHGALPPKSASEQNQPKLMYAMYAFFMFLHMFHNSFHNKCSPLASSISESVARNGYGRGNLIPQISQTAALIATMNLKSSPVEGP